MCIRDRCLLATRVRTLVPSQPRARRQTRNRNKPCEDRPTCSSQRRARPGSRRIQQIDCKGETENKLEEEEGVKLHKGKGREQAGGRKEGRARRRAQRSWTSERSLRIWRKRLTMLCESRMVSLCCEGETAMANETRRIGRRTRGTARRRPRPNRRRGGG